MAGSIIRVFNASDTAYKWADSWQTLSNTTDAVY